MARLFVEPALLGDDRVRLTDEDARYLTRVLRLGPGHHVTLFDGQGREADAAIERVDRHGVELRVGERRRVERAAGPSLTLVVGLARGEKLDLVVQKATELGAHHVVPVVTARAVLELDERRAELRRARWLKIAREAARQSGRADVPEIAAPIPFEEAMTRTEAALKLLFWEEARASGLRERLAAMTPPASVAVVVGPEGGLTAAEVELARAAGFLVAGLGPRILRAETAALAALTIVNYALGDLG
jgi:16S rRNA (uracil1498-N3)-methyltransferase